MAWTLFPLQDYPWLVNNCDYFAILMFQIAPQVFARLRL
jgi:hypothetical protein